MKSCTDETHRKLAAATGFRRCPQCGAGLEAWRASTPVIELAPFALETVEHSISPPMGSAITLPVLLNGLDTGIAVYVATSAFHQTPDDDERVQRVASLIVRMVNDAGKRLGAEPMPGSEGGSND